LISSNGLTISAVDYHTGGEPFRIITGWVPPIPGDSVLAKRRYAMENLDDLRRLVVFEPRGHADMYGCFVTEPNDDGADLGVIFFHNAGFSTACGHGTIALVTWAIESGVIAVQQPEMPVVVDVPSGRLHTVATVTAAGVRSVRFLNVPAFVHSESLSVDTSLGEISADVSYGGAFYASVDVTSSGLEVKGMHLTRLVELGREIKRSIELDHTVVHPEEPEIRDIYGVTFFQDEGQDATSITQRNVTIFADGEVDRSPCGSGTSARLAILHKSGRLPVGNQLTHLSIIDSAFVGHVVGATSVRGTPAVLTEVEGSAHLSGYHNFILRPDDPLGTGFLLR
jgi:proline racemase